MMNKAPLRFLRQPPCGSRQPLPERLTRASAAIAFAAALLLVSPASAGYPCSPGIDPIYQTLCPHTNPAQPNFRAHRLDRRFSGRAEMAATIASLRRRKTPLSNRRGESGTLGEVRDTASSAQAQPKPLAQSAPPYVSAIAIGGSDTTEILGSTVDSDGNLLVAGGFYGSVTFSTTPPTTLTSTADSDLFVAKYTPAGACLWVRMAAGATGLPAGLSLDGALSVAVDPQNNVYVGGGFVNSLSFLDGQNRPAGKLTASGSAGVNFEAFVAKYDRAGSLIWAQGGQSISPQDPQDLEAGINGVTNVIADAAGNLFVGGTSSGAQFLGQAVTPVSYGGGVLARLDPKTGSVIWLVQLESGGFDGIEDIGSDGAGGVYALGFGGGDQMTFQTLPQPTALDLTGTYDGSYLARFNGAGAALWARLVDDRGAVYAAGLAVSPAGQPYVTGSVLGFGLATAQSKCGDSSGGDTFDGIPALGITDPCDEEAFLAQYDSAGHVRWVRDIQTRNTATEYSQGSKVAVDSAGNAYVMGPYLGNITLTGNPSSPFLTLMSGDDEDTFLAQYDAAGTPRWVRSISSPGKANVGLQASMAVPVYISSGALSYSANARALTVSGDFQGMLTLDGGIQVSAAGANRASFVAMLPATDKAGPTANPTVRPVVGATGWTPQGQYYVDVTITNTSPGTALNTTLAGETIRVLTGSGTVKPAGPALPASFGDVGPGASQTVRLYFQVSDPKAVSRFSVVGSIAAQNGSAGVVKSALSAAVVVTAPQ